MSDAAVSSKDGASSRAAELEALRSPKSSNSLPAQDDDGVELEQQEESSADAAVSSKDGASARAAELAALSSSRNRNSRGVASGSHHKARAQILHPLLVCPWEWD